MIHNMSAQAQRRIPKIISPYNTFLISSSAYFTAGKEKTLPYLQKKILVSHISDCCNNHRQKSLAFSSMNKNCSSSSMYMCQLQRLFLS